MSNLVSDDFTIITRKGNPIQLPIFIDMGVDGKPKRYILNPEDKLVFAIMYPDQYFEDHIFRKIFTSKDTNNLGDVVLKLTMEDMYQFEPGIYEYVIKLFQFDPNTESNYRINTIIPQSRLIINCCNGI